MKSFSIFFSNRSKDQDDVNKLKKQLRELLPNLPFEDVSEEVPFVDDWKVPASKILESCDALVCVVGPETYASEPVNWEIHEACKLEKPLVVTRLSEEFKKPPCCIERRIPVMEWNDVDLAGHIGELLVSRVLFLHHDWTKGRLEPEMLWNQYNLMVQSWEALISRRQTVNTLYVSAVAALLAAVGLLISTTENGGFSGVAEGVALLALLGVALCFNWRRTIVSYGTLSKAKSKVIGALEAHLPAQLFDAEWRVLEAKRYKSTTETDKQTALFFLLAFLSVVIVSVGISVGTWWPPSWLFQ